MGTHSLALAMMLLASSGDETVLLEFSSTRCIPCRRMEPVIDSLIAEGFPIRKLDTDRDRSLAMRYNIHSVPCFIMLREGQEVERTIGTLSESQLRRMLQRNGAGPKPLEMAENVSPQPEAEAPEDALPKSIPTAGPASIWARGSASEGKLKKIAAANGLASLQDAALLAATVRLRIHEPTRSFSTGTGTIIDSQGGEALIVTCAHIFRDYADGGRIEIDLFDSDPPRQVLGMLVSYNDKLDVGFVRIRVEQPVVAIPVAPPGFGIEVGDCVANVGCNHGDDPTIRHNVITAINRFVGAPNIEVGGQPVQGRSGGGLFSKDGYLIGICNAADPELNEGIYAGLESIIAELDRLQFSFVYRRPSSRAVGQVASAPLPELPREMPPVRTPAVAVPAAAPAASLAGDTSINTARLTREQLAMLRELERQMASGAEVTALVYRDQPQPTAAHDASSRVIMLDNQSRSALGRVFAAQNARTAEPSFGPAAPPASFGRSDAAPARSAPDAWAGGHSRPIPPAARPAAAPLAPVRGSGSAGSAAAVRTAVEAPSWGYPMRQ